MFMRDISTIMRRMRVFGERHLTQYEIGFAEQMVLMYLTAQGESSQEAIARYFNLDKGTVAKTVAKLEEGGFLIRETDPKDRRTKKLRLTEKASGPLSDMRGLSDELRSGMYAGMTDEEVAAFEASLEKVARNVVSMTERN